MQDKEVKATITAVSPTPLNTKVTPVPDETVRKPTLENLQELEDQLNNLINNLAEDKKDTLLRRLKEDATLVTLAGIDQLDDSKNYPLEDSKGLKDRQAKTRKSFSETLAGIDHDQKSTLEKQLLAIHTMRESLLSDALEAENQKLMDAAYDAFLRHMGDQGYSVSARKTGEPADSKFMHRIKDNPTFDGPDGMKVHVRGNTFESNDPEALGMALVAAGNKTVTLSAEKPEIALRAAEAALAAGAEEINFDQNTLKKITDPYQEYKSWNEYQASKARYEALMNQMAAKKTARANGPNSVFNDSSKLTTAQQNAQVFKNISTHEQGHLQMLIRMTPRERAELAYEFMKDKKEFVKYGVKYDGYNYVRSLLHSDLYPSFDEAYGKVTAAAVLPKIKEPTKSPEEIAAEIAKQPQLDTRNQLYARINDELIPPTTQNAGNARNWLRAAAIAHTLNRHYDYYVQNKGNPDIKRSSKIGIDCKTEIQKILADTQQNEREIIRGMFNRCYHRGITPDQVTQLSDPGLYQALAKITHECFVQMDKSQQQESQQQEKDTHPPFVVKRAQPDPKDSCDSTEEEIEVEPLDEPLDEPLYEPLDEPLYEPLDEPLYEPLDEPLDEPKCGSRTRK